MTRAGEVGGFLDAVMLQIAENYEAEVRLKGKIKAAMLLNYAGLDDNIGKTRPGYEDALKAAKVI